VRFSNIWQQIDIKGSTSLRHFIRSIYPDPYM